MTQKLKMLFCDDTKFSIFILENDTNCKISIFMMTQIIFIHISLYHFH